MKTEKWITEKELEKMYEELLTECNELVVIGNLSYEAGKVLRLVDPIAFKCGMNDWLDSQVSERVFEEKYGEYFTTYDSDK